MDLPEPPRELRPARRADRSLLDQHQPPPLGVDDSEAGGDGAGIDAENAHDEDYEGRRQKSEVRGILLLPSALCLPTSRTSPRRSPSPPPGTSPRSLSAADRRARESAFGTGKTAPGAGRRSRSTRGGR